MIGAPRDFDELVQQYGSVIRTIEACDVLQVAHHLWSRGVLQNYHPPRLLTLAQLQEYVGVSATLWSYALQQPSKRLMLPIPAEGTRMDPASKYRFVDARAFLARRAEVFTALASRRGFKPVRLPGYAEFLLLEAKKIVNEMQRGYVFDLPAGLPQNNAELLSEYALSVAQVVRRRLKYGMEIEDAINEIWLKLFKAEILIKFVRSGASRLPSQLTLDETLDFLGVDWPAWQRMMKDYADAPNPVKGAASSMTAIYASEDIVTLDQAGYFKERGPRILPAYAVSREMLNKYVMRAAEQHLKNLFRTLERRFNREDTVQDCQYISENRSIRYRRPDVNQGQAWEDTLRSEEPLADQVLELKQRLGVAGEVYEVFTALAC